MISGASKRTINLKFGITKGVKTCCKNCWKKLRAACRELNDLLTDINQPGISYTMCSSCEKIVIEQHTVPIKDPSTNKQVGLNCYNCCDIDDIPSVADMPDYEDSEESKDEVNRASLSRSGDLGSALKTHFNKAPTNIQHKVDTPVIAKSNEVDEEFEKILNLVNTLDMNGPLASVMPGTMKRFSVCSVRGCIAGSDATWLTTYVHLLSVCGSDSKKVREMFRLEEGVGGGFCCRICFKRMKYYGAYLKGDLVSKSTSISLDSKPLTTSDASNVTLSTPAQPLQRLFPLSQTSSAVSLVSVDGHLKYANVKSLKNAEGQTILIPVTYQSNTLGNTMSYQTVGQGPLVKTPKGANLSSTIVTELKTPVTQGHMTSNPTQFILSPINVSRQPGSSKVIAPSPVRPLAPIISPNQFVVVTTQPPLTGTITSPKFLNLTSITPRSVMKLDKICQTGLVYSSSSGDNCIGSVLTKPYSEITDMKLKAAVKKQAKDMYSTFIKQLDELTQGCGMDLLTEFSHPKVTFLF